MRRYEITDDQWQRIAKFFPEKQPGTRGRPPKDSRTILNGIIWLARSGAPLRDLPERYGPWETVYSRFRELLENGVLQAIFQELTIDADMENLAIDSTSIRVHQHAAGAKKGANPLKSDVQEAD